MNIRKLLHLLTNKQKAVIAADVKHILSGCDSIANTEWREQLENKKSHDGQCPKCQSGIDNIVDRVSQVQGVGKFNGSFKLGYGDIKSLIVIDTIEVNHCNVCGNEWKKFKTKYINKTDILRVALRYLGEIITDPEKNKMHDWKVEAIQVFDDCNAETIHKLLQANKKYIPTELLPVMKLKTLRQQYKSVFN